MSISFLSSDTPIESNSFLSATASSGTSAQDTETINTLQFNLGQYEVLNNKIISTIKELLIQYSTSDFEGLKKSLPVEFYNSLSTVLYDNGSFNNISVDYEYNPILFTVYKKAFHRVLEGLQQSISLHNKWVDSTIELNHAINRAEILDDMNKLKKYLEDKQSALFFADVKTQLKEMAVLKPQYQRYIDKYGVPEGLIFESEKMAIVIQELIKEEAITEDDIFGDYNPGYRQ